MGVIVCAGTYFCSCTCPFMCLFLYSRLYACFCGDYVRICTFMRVLCVCVCVCVCVCICVTFYIIL